MTSIPAMQAVPAQPDSRPARCVLVIEDEMQLASMIQYILTHAGYRVLHAARVDTAMEIVRSGVSIDAALVDINLNGREVFPVTAALRERGVPFVFASGYGREGLPPEFSDCQVVQKPFLPESITNAVAALF